MTDKARPRKVGRPSLYCEEMEESIISGLIDGKSLVEICEPASMPNRVTVMRWMNKDAGFATRIARAREEQGEDSGCRGRYCDPNGQRVSAGGFPASHMNSRERHGAA
jgi:hypothetical protein